MNVIKNETCVLCLDQNALYLYKDEHFTYEICKSCGHVYQSNRKDQYFYNQIPYTVAQKKVNNIDLNMYDTHVKNRASYIYDFISTIIDIKKYKTLLDIGCGYGGVSFYLDKLVNFEKITGVTPDFDVTNKNFYQNIDFINTTYDEPINGEFDLVILVHTLEHFLDPIKALFDIRKNMSENGVLYIEVPSFNWEGMIVSPIYTPVHISYFTKKILINILKFCGYKIIKIKESKYWANIKILVKKDLNYKNNFIQQKFFKKNAENWIYKQSKLNILKVFMYPVIKFLKKKIKINSNS